MTREMNYQWRRFEKAEKLILSTINEFKKDNALIKTIDSNITTLTSSRTLDWTDHILVPDTQEMTEELTALGFQEQEDSDVRAYEHPGALLPRVILSVQGGPKK